MSKGGNINTKTAIGEKGRLHLILAAALLPATSFGQAWLPDKGVFNAALIYNDVSNLAHWGSTWEAPPQPDGSPAEDKIAAIGVRIRRWKSFHGVAINVEPDLGHFAGIVPCGIRGHGVTSLVDLGLPVTLADLDLALGPAFEQVFGRTGGLASPERGR